jgi:hypothetical protein
VNPTENRGEENKHNGLLVEARLCFYKWRRRMTLFGVALFLSSLSVVPFLYGHSLHSHWETTGKYLVILSMCLLSLFGGTSWLTYNFWVYAREIERTEKRPD